MPAASRPTSSLPRRRRPRRTLAAVLLAGAATALAGPSAAVPSAAAVPAAPAWAWPLEASAGPPPVLRGFTAPVHRWSPGHRGVDLGAAVGAPVLAPVDGVVVFAGRVVDRDLVSVAGPGGLRVTLEPVAATVAAGAVVRRGQQVGVLAGSPAHCAPQSCLHWGVRSGADAYRDPLALLRSPGPPVLLPLDGDPVQQVPVRSARVRRGGLGWAPV